MKRKGTNMRGRTFVFLMTLSALLVATAALSADQYLLKPGARGKLCINCHENFENTLKSSFLHTPVKTGDCSGCHNPHTSSHGKLLDADPGRICLKCHDEVAPENARSRHKVVAEGKCTACHDPHGSNNKANLVKAGNELCFGCHKELGQLVQKAKFKHSPVEKGCLSCHDPHASEKFTHLVKEDVPGLCIKCHRTDKPAFVRQHNGYPVARGRCTSCHNAHGSDQPVIMYANTHRPVMNRMCKQCHEPPSSPDPFKVKANGYELCRGCHSKMINETLGKKRVHWAIVGKRGCLACHAPHASSEAALMNGPMTNVCSECHSDTIERQAASPAKHEPVLKGQCKICHLPHASDESLLLTNVSSDKLCGECHNWREHSSHPIGEKHLDMRNQNLKVSCLSCHRSHGTPYKKLIPFATSTDLCVQCHEKLKR